MIKRTIGYFVFLLFIASCGKCFANKTNETILLLFEQNGLYGYADTNGTVIIEPQWEYAEPFFAGIALVSHNSEPFVSCADGLIDMSGEYILSPNYMIETSAMFYIIASDQCDELLYGYYDVSSHYFQQPTFESIWNGQQESSNDLIAAQKNGKWGFLQRATGKIVIPLQYDDIIEDFTNGFALVCNELSNANSIGAYDQYLLINENGESVQFCDGIMPVSAPSEEGIVVIIGLAQAEDQRNVWGGKTVYGLGKVDGTVVISPSMAYISPFIEKYTSFCNQYSQWGIMNSNGTVLVQPTIKLKNTGFFEPIVFSDGYAVFETDNEQWVLMDLYGNVTSLQYDGQITSVGTVIKNSLLIPFTEKREKAILYGFWSIDGSLTIPPSFDEYFSYYCGLCRVKMNGKYGYMNECGKLIIPCIYDAAMDFDHGMAYVRMGDAQFFLNIYGESLPIKQQINIFNQIEPLSTASVYSVVDDNIKEIITKHYVYLQRH